MSTEIATTEPTTASGKYAALIRRTAEVTLADFVDEETLRHAMGRFGLAFRAAASAARDPSKFYGADPASVALCVGMSAITGLMPGGPYPDVYLVPYGRKLDWQVSARGMRKLARRNGWALDPVLVHKGDDFRLSRGLHPDIHHIPGDGPKTWDTLVGGYVVAWPPGGARPLWAWLDREGIERRRDLSQGYRSGGSDTPWRQWPMEMAQKTLVRYGIGRGICDLDEIGNVAMGVDGRHDIVDAPVPAQVEPAPQLEARGGMAGLADALGADPEPTWAEQVEAESAAEEEE